MDDVHRLETLFQARHPCVSIVTHEESYALELVRSAAHLVDVSMNIWSAVKGLRGGLIEDDGDSATMNPAAALFASMQSHNRQILVMLDLAAHLDDATTLRTLRELIDSTNRTSSTVVLVDHQDLLPAVIRSTATPYAISLPDEQELGAILKRTVREVHREVRVDARLSEETFQKLVGQLVGLTRGQARRVVMDALMDDFALNVDDVPGILASKRALLHMDGLLEYVERLESMDQIGGLETLKTWLDHRRLAMGGDGEKFGLQSPRGVLLLGVQGAGKSLCAKAIATAWERPLLRMDPSVLYDRYIGESERRLRDALEQAEAMSPIVLWIDEIEKGFASAASHSVDGGLSQRMFGSLLTWMQEHATPVFLVATANNIEALPPELLRKGRFDEIFFVDLPGEAGRKAIFEIHLRRRDRDPAAFDLARLVGASQGYSGAEIEQAIISGLHEAYSSKGELDTDVLERAILASPPLSVTMREKIGELRAWARDRCVFAG